MDTCAIALYYDCTWRIYTISPYCISTVSATTSSKKKQRLVIPRNLQTRSRGSRRPRVLYREVSTYPKLLFTFQKRRSPTQQLLTARMQRQPLRHSKSVTIYTANLPSQFNLSQMKCQLKQALFAPYLKTTRKKKAMTQEPTKPTLKKAALNVPLCQIRKAVQPRRNHLVTKIFFMLLLQQQKQMPMQKQQPKRHQRKCS